MKKPILEDQIELERQFNKNQTIKRLVKEYNVQVIQDICKENNLDLQFVLHLLSHICILKQADLSTLVGLLKNHFQSLQECADNLWVAVSCDLIDWYDDREVFGQNPYFNMKASVMAEIDKYQFPLPMIVEPKTVKRNKDTGYYSEYAEYGSIILNKNYHDYDVNLDHINRLNKLQYGINSFIAHRIHNSWNGINSRKPSESDIDFEKRKKNFQRYNSVAYDVINGLSMFDSPIYITNKYDKRGRCYSVGYHINPQGNSWNKASIEFFNKEIIEDELPEFS